MSACDHLERALLADLLAPDAATRAHVANCADCAARLAGYERMAQALGEIGAAHARRPDHLARLWATVDAAPPRRPWWRARWPLVLAPALVVAVAALALWPRVPPAPRFAVEIVAGSQVALRGDAHLGDRVRVRARVGAAVWIYRNDHELLLQCPRACARDGEALAAERPLDEVARYQIVWLSTAAVPAPTGDLARDLAAATAAGATHELRELRVE